MYLGNLMKSGPVFPVHSVISLIPKCAVAL